MVDPSAIAAAFLKTYSEMMATGSAETVVNLYGEDSLMSGDGTNVKGKAPIAAYLAAKFAAGPIAIRFSAQDALPSQATGGIAVFCTGELMQGAARSLFQAVFMLFPTPAGGLFVRSEIFRTGPGASAMNNAAGGGIAQAFVASYYEIFDRDRSALAAIYRPTSMLLFEGAPAMGVAPVLEKLAALPPTKHQIETLDSQPIQENVINVVVTGKILLEGQENPLMFAQLFHIVIEAAGPYVAGDVFRLNYA